MKGLLFTDITPLAARFDPILPHFKPLWWFGDFQSGPFSTEWMCSDDANLQRVEDAHFDVPICNNTSAQVWRPGTLPDLLPHLYFDEWSYLTGFMADQKDVDTIVNHFMQCEDFCSVEFFAAVKQFAKIHIIDVDDGRFEVYAPTNDWLHLLRARWPDAKYIDSDKWQRE